MKCLGAPLPGRDTLGLPNPVVPVASLLPPTGYHRTDPPGLGAKTPIFLIHAACLVGIIPFVTLIE